MPPDAIEVEIHRSDDRGSVLQPPAPILDKVGRRVNDSQESECDKYSAMKLRHTGMIMYLVVI